MVRSEHTIESVAKAYHNLNMTPATSIEKFLAEQVALSLDNPFSDGHECPICMHVEEAVLPYFESVSTISTRSPTAVVQTFACSHMFHKQ